MLKTILCKFTILHIIYCGMWHILQETFGARNNCKAVAFDFQIRKTKIKRQRKEEGVGEPWPPLGPRPTSASRTAHSPLLLAALGICPAAQPPPSVVFYCSTDRSVAVATGPAHRRHRRGDKIPRRLGLPRLPSPLASSSPRSTSPLFLTPALPIWRKGPTLSSPSPRHHRGHCRPRAPPACPPASPASATPSPTTGSGRKPPGNPLPPRLQPPSTTVAAIFLLSGDPPAATKPITGLLVPLSEPFILLPLCSLSRAL